jgi:hypothetical protein
MKIDKTRNIAEPEKVRLRRSTFAPCPICDKTVELLSFDAAAEVFNTDVQDIEFLAGNGSVHRVHNRKGKVMICSISLFDCFDKRRTRLLDSHFAGDMHGGDGSNH